MTRKAETHIVEPNELGFVVTSGATGRVYIVKPLAEDTAKASCTCERGRHEAPASSCSHVQAVYLFAARLLGIAI